MDKLPASFRDPSGFLFSRQGVLYRQVNQTYAPDYDLLMDSGLYQKLVETGRLVSHIETALQPTAPGAYKIIQPEMVPFISYPYEWSFGQLKEAALATLSIQKRAMQAGMSLKDACAYNIQFLRGRATLIDTLSFERLVPGEPWVAYRQFCQHFLAPLALMSRRNFRLGQLLRSFIDGIPLDLASTLLPAHTWFNFGLATHLHLHARAQQKYANASLDRARAGRAMKPQSLAMLIENLGATVNRLQWKPAGGTEWGQYYENTNYSGAAFEHKGQLVTDWARRVNPRLVWDLGANTGVFSRQVTVPNAQIVSWDIDPAAVEKNWAQVKAEKTTALLPLVLDLTNPSPAIGWDNQERASLSQRGPADLLLALALIHHLAISNNLPFDNIAATFSKWGKNLVIEFVPKSDSQVQKLLLSRKDIFPNYDRQNFESVFSCYFTILESQPVHESERWIYLMKAL